VGTPEKERRGRFARPHVVVAGGGVAALEACLGLGRHRARVTLIAPNAVFTHRPPGAPPADLPLATVADASSAALLHDRVTRVESDRRRVRTAGGRELRYDALLLATGAAGREPPAPSASRPAVLVAPPGPIWRLELYELALEAASASRGRDVVLVTTEERPLELLGPRASSLAAAALLAAGVRVRTGTYATALTPRGARVWAAGELVEGAVVEASRLTGRLPAGIPVDARGFAQTDPLGRVAGVEHVYAAPRSRSSTHRWPPSRPTLSSRRSPALPRHSSRCCGGCCRLWLAGTSKCRSTEGTATRRS
jgi:NADH dehydrogenase FAD-containing subunit